MSLKFIYGRSGTGKSTYCLKQIKKMENGKNFLIVPEQYSLQMEKKLSQIVNNNLNRIEVLSFKRLIHKVFNETGKPLKPILSAAAKNIILLNVIKKNDQKLKVLKKSHSLSGYINTLGDTISEFKRYNIVPEDFESIPDLVTNNLSKMKLKDIGLLYNEYEKEINNLYIDADDELTIIKDKLEKSKMFDGASIFFDEFTGFTPQQYEIIRMLLKKANQVNVSILTDYLESDFDHIDSGFFSVPRKTVSKIMIIAKEENIEIEKPVGLKEGCRLKGNEELIHFENNFFSFPYKEYKEETRNISIYSAENHYLEVEHIAKQIINMCRDKKIRYRDISVITGDISEYEKIIKIVFNEYSIPYFIDVNKDIFNNKLIVLVLSIFEMFITNWSYESVFKYLKTDLLGIEKSEIDLLENFVLETGIKGYKKWIDNEKWDDYFEYFIKDKENLRNTYKIIFKTRKKIIEPILKFKEKVDSKKNIENYCFAVFEILEELSITKSLENLTNDMKNTGKLGLANEYGQIWDMLIYVLEEIYNTSDFDETVKISEYYELFKISLSAFSVGLVPASLDQVNVGTFKRSKDNEVKVTFIIGMNDGKIPAVNRENGLISDSERAELLENGKELAPDSKIRSIEENYIIYSTLFRSSQNIFFSYSSSDLEGKTLRPSIIFTMIKSIFPKMIVLNDEKDREGEISLPKPEYKKLSNLLRNIFESGKYEEKHIQICKWFCENNTWKNKYINMLKTFNYTNQVDILEKDTVNKIFDKEIYTSVSRLEQYIKCPFSYYIRYIIKAKERNLYELSYPEMGSFVHKILEKVLKEVDYEQENKGSLFLGYFEELSYKEIQKEMKKTKNSIFSSSYRNLHLTNKTAKTIARCAYVIYKNMVNSRFRPLGYEMNIKDNSILKPLEIDLDKRKIKIRGIIDRVDSYSDEDRMYVKIVDYKTGKDSYSLNDIYNGLKLQLITYLNLLIKNNEAFSNKEIIPCAMLYFNVDNPIISVDNSNVDDETIELEIVKKLKMNGLIIKDKDIIKNMDYDFDGKSLYYPIKLKKDNNFDRYSKVADRKQIESLCEYSSRYIEGTVKDMLDGNFKIIPYKNKKGTACDYCKFSSVCQFDLAIRENKYKIINEYKEEYIWEEIEKIYEKGCE